MLFVGNRIQIARQKLGHKYTKYPKGLGNAYFLTRVAVPVNHSSNGTEILDIFLIKTIHSTANNS